VVVFEGRRLPRKSENSINIGKNRPSKGPSKGPSNNDYWVRAGQARTAGPPCGTHAAWRSLSDTSSRSQRHPTTTRSRVACCSDYPVVVVTRALTRALTGPIFTDFYRFFGLSWETSALKNYHPEDSEHSGSGRIEFSSKSTTFLM